MNLKDYLIGECIVGYKDIQDLNFIGVLKDNEGIPLSFENFKINKVTNKRLWITHGGDWQTPKQAIYQYDGGTESLELVGEGTLGDI